MTPEFSRLERVDALPARGRQVEISASEEERRALAQRFGILSIESLSASLRLVPVGRRQMVRVTGRLLAEVVQACVVSLEPVPERIAEDFELAFGPEEEDNGGEIDVSFECEDPPDPIVDGEIDLGEAVAEHLALALEPFPRAPGAEFTPPPESAPVVEEKINPFAALAGLRKNDG